MKHYEQEMKFKYCVKSGNQFIFSNNKLSHSYLGDVALENVELYFEGNDKFTTLCPSSLTVSASIIEYDYSLEDGTSNFDLYAMPPKVSKILKIKYIPRGWNELKKRVKLNSVYYDIKSISHSDEDFSVRVG